MKIIWRSLKNGKRTVTKIKNNYIQSFQGANFATWSWCGSQRPAPYMLYPFVGWTRDVQPIFNFQVVKKSTWFWWWSLRPPPFLPFGTMLRNNIKKISTLFGTISKKYRHYSETFRHCSESLFLLDFQVIKRITWFQVLILRTWSVKWCGLGRGDPPQNQWVKMDHWFLSEQYRKKSLVLFRI